MSNDKPFCPVPKEQLESGGASPDLEFSWACNKSGRCCFGTPVLINPQDIFRLVSNKEVMDRIGCQTTHDLFHPTTGKFNYYLGKHSNMPVCSIRQLPEEYGEACPFVAPVMELASLGNVERLQAMHGPNGAMHLCGIHEARPTICRGYPIGRWRAGEAKATNSLLEGTQHIAMMLKECQNCYPDMLKDPGLWKGTVKQWIAEQNLEEDWKATDEWWGVMDLIRNADLIRESRLIIGVFAYDFDYPWVKRNVPVPEIIAKRPKTATELLARVTEVNKAFIDLRQERIGLIEALEVFSKYGLPKTTEKEALALIAAENSEE